MIQFTKRICCVYRGGTWCSGNVRTKNVGEEKVSEKGTTRNQLFTL